MFGLGVAEVIILLLVVFLPLLVALRGFVPASRAVRHDALVREVDLVREWTALRDVWRDGNLMVVRSDARLPERCIVTNQPAAASVRLTLVWHPPALYLAVFGGVFLYLILAVLIRKKVVVTAGVSEQVAMRHRNARWAAAITVAAGLALVALGASTESLVFPNVGVLLVVVALAIWMIGTRIVRPVRIESGFAWVKGVSPDYLMTLPSWDEFGLRPPA